jgi:hypothetical protein
MKQKRSAHNVQTVAIVAFIAHGLFFDSSQLVHGADWQQIAYSPELGTTVEIDKASIKNKGDYLEVFIKSTSKQTDNALIVQTIGYKCSERKEKLFKVHVVKRDGKVVDIDYEKDMAWSVVKPGGITTEGFKVVCK